MTDQDQPEGRTHLCVDGTTKPGPGYAGKGPEKCPKCWAEYLRARRAKKKEEKWAGKPGVVGQVPLNRGHDGSATTKHGFYRKKLGPTEAKLATQIHAEFHAKYVLDSLVDDMLLHTAIVNFVKSLRKEPDWTKERGDKNVRDLQAYHEREFRDILDKLALTPKQRKEETKNNDVAKAIEALFRKKSEEFSGP